MHTLIEHSVIFSVRFFKEYKEIIQNLKRLVFIKKLCQFI